MHNQGWRARAACAGRSPNLWFPEGAGNSAATQEAVAICRSCPVRTQCAEYALAQPENFGIWGGLTQDDRKNLTLARPRRRLHAEPL
ncbi:WhiB family transcriptional regulator [Mycolicibacterium sp.]|uniref:WhiB family transcriptional regulator n=1 Tax=Mycolicibacterium sp. TaxID=2320850 RepID=UPI0028A7EFBB|nr:WhiB family transcriptional regulator [Mycolicibacterium sp.]